MEDLPAYLWLTVVLGGPIVLGVVFIYGIVQWRRRRSEARRRGERSAP